MTNNTEVVTVGPAFTFVRRNNSRGKALGSRFNFEGTENASALRARLKASGVKGKDLTAQVNAVLTGNASSKRVMGMAAMSHMAEKGFVPDCIDLNKAQTKATITLYRVEEQKPAEVTKADALKLLGITDEQLAALLAKQA